MQRRARSQRRKAVATQARCSVFAKKGSGNTSGWLAVLGCRSEAFTGSPEVSAAAAPQSNRHQPWAEWHRTAQGKAALAWPFRVQQRQPLAERQRKRERQAALSERTCEGAHKERRHAGGRGGGLPVLSEHAADAEGEGRQAAVCLGQKAAFFRSDRKERRVFLLQTVPFEVWTVGFERSARRFCGH